MNKDDEHRLTKMNSGWLGYLFVFIFIMAIFGTLLSKQNDEKKIASEISEFLNDTGQLNDKGQDVLTYLNCINFLETKDYTQLFEQSRDYGRKLNKFSRINISHPVSRFKIENWLKNQGYHDESTRFIKNVTATRMTRKSTRVFYNDYSSEFSCGRRGVLKIYTFDGSPCNSICEGHKAGHKWGYSNAKEEHDCENKSSSFEQGCLVGFKERYWDDLEVRCDDERHSESISLECSEYLDY